MLENALIVAFTSAWPGLVRRTTVYSGNAGRARFGSTEGAMPMGSVPTVQAARDHTLPLVFYPDFLAICTFVAVGLATSLGFAVAFPSSTNLITSFCQLGG
jgi:hypothetical protein